MQRILIGFVGITFLIATTEAAGPQAPRDFGTSSAAPRVNHAATQPGETSSRHILPGTRASVFATVQGNALTANSNPLANASVRLRDMRLGRIIGTRVTDKSGLFAFSSLDPGNYIVELLGHDESILAVSEMVSPAAGEVRSVVVKLPWLKPEGGVMSGGRPAALAVLAAAAASGVLGRTTTGQPISTR
jgi:hypothetical protein